MMVVKLDAQCRVVWSRHYGAPSSHVFVGSIRTDASGNVVLGGGFLTSFPYGHDFGTGPQSANQSGMFVTKLDPNGKTVWVDTAIAPSDDSTTGISYAGDLAIDASGNVVLIYEGPAALGVTSDGGYAITNELVKLDPGGKVVFAKSSDELEPAAWHIESVDVARDGSIWAAGSADEASSDIRVVHVGANGAPIASQVMSSPSSPCSVSGGAVRVSPTAGITVSGARTPPSAADWTRWFVGLSPSASPGPPAWTRSPIVASGSSSGPAHRKAVGCARRAPSVPRRGRIPEDGRGQLRKTDPSETFGRSNGWTKRAATSPGWRCVLCRIRSPVAPLTFCEQYP
jgi:hypothetical protein